jgi:hypothetical protein
VAQHHRVDGFRVGWAAGGSREDPGHVLEVGPAEHARGRDCQKRHVVLAGDEAVDLAASDAGRIAGADVNALTVDRESDRSLDPVDRLLEGIVAVGEGNAGAGRDVAARDGDRAVGVLRLDREVNRDRPEVDRFVGV